MVTAVTTAVGLRIGCLPSLTSCWPLFNGVGSRRPAYMQPQEAMIPHKHMLWAASGHPKPQKRATRAEECPPHSQMKDRQVDKPQLGRSAQRVQDSSSLPILCKWRAPCFTMLGCLAWKQEGSQHTDTQQPRQARKHHSALHLANSKRQE